MRRHAASRRFAVFVASALLAGCGGSSTVQQSTGVNAVPILERFTQRAAMLPANALIAADYKSGDLKYWPIVAHGTDNHPGSLVKGLGLKEPIGMAADGDELVIAGFSQITVFNVSTMQASSLPDPDGFPVDITVGKTGSIYALNINNVGTSTNIVEYSRGSKNPNELSCGLMQDGAELAVDNEGDAFLNGTNNNGRSFSRKYRADPSSADSSRYVPKKATLPVLPSIRRPTTCS